MSATDLRRLETGIRQAHKQGDTKTVDVLGAELRRVHKMQPSKKAPPKRSLFGAAIEAIPNIPSSAAEFATGLYTAVTNPIQTASSMMDLAAGGLKAGAEQVLPKNVYNFINDMDRDPKSAERAMRAARQFGGQMADRYGTYDAIKNTLATDPVGFAADMSTLLSGGASVAGRAGRTGTAGVLNKMAQATNPVNVLKPAGRVVAKAAQRAPLKIANVMAPKSAAYMETAEGRAPELIAQLRRPDLEIVPGSKPTAAQAASPLGLTKFSAMGETSAKALPSQNLARANEADAARLASLRTVGGTPNDIASAVKAREAAARPFYNQADKVLVAADKKFEGLLTRPSMDKVLARASELAAEKGVPFQIGKNRPEQTIPSKILNAEGQPMGSITVPGETAKYPGSSLHMMKMAFDDLIKNPERFGIGATEVRAISQTRNEYLNWAENKVPAYKTARETFAAKSKPINQMEVGQYLEGKLTAPLEGGAQRANVFATAVKDAPGTLKRATNNQVRFKELTDVLTPEQAGIVNAIRDDLNRVQTTKTQAQKGASAAPRITQLASQIGDAPAVLNRVVTIANTIFNRLQGQIDRKLAIQIATEMLDPQVAAAAIEKAMVRERRAATTGRVTGAVGRGTGKVLTSGAVKAGAQTQNIMTQAQNQNAMNNIYGITDFPDFDPESGNPLVDIDYSEGYPVPIYGTLPENMRFKSPNFKSSNAMRR
jgi:hypothetical protein